MLELIPLTEAEIEERARRLCEIRGENPDARPTIVREMSRLQVSDKTYAEHAAIAIRAADHMRVALGPAKVGIEIEQIDGWHRFHDAADKINNPDTKYRGKVVEVVGDTSNGRFFSALGGECRSEWLILSTGNVIEPV